MAIRSIKQELEKALEETAIELKRNLQYEQMINRVLFNKARLIQDFYKMFNLNKRKNTEEVREIKALVDEVVSKVFSTGSVKDFARKNGFEVASSLSSAKEKARKDFHRTSGRGSTNLVVIDGNSRESRIAFVYSHQKGAGVRKFSGNEVLKDLKVAALEKIQSFYTKKNRRIPKSAKSGELQRLHGIIDKGIQTTVAVGAVVETLISMRESNSLGVPPQVFDRFLHYIYMDYKLQRRRFEGLEDFYDNFIFDIELGHREDNKAQVITAADAPALRKALPKFEKRMLKYFKGNYSGSRKPKEVLKGKGEKVITDKVLEKVITRPRDARGRFIKVTKAKSTEKDLRKTENLKGRKTIQKGKKSRTKTSGKAAKPVKTKVATKTQDSAIKLRALLDRMLPQVVASKMVEPRLVYRTGRFAQSVRTENVVIGPRGGIHIDYTYMKYPYQTFEPGFVQGSKYRDPRSIIKESIRDIAITLVGEKFMTIRRV